MSNSVEKVWTQAEISKAKSYHAHFHKFGAEALNTMQMLWEFKEEGLYLLFARSWQEFIEKEMGWSRQRGNQFLDAYKVVRELPNECKQIVVTESHARALKPVPAAERPKVVQQAHVILAVTVT